MFNDNWLLVEEPSQYTLLNVPPFNVKELPHTSFFEFSDISTLESNIKLLSPAIILWFPKFNVMFLNLISLNVLSTGKYKSSLADKTKFLSSDEIVSLQFCLSAE